MPVTSQALVSIDIYCIMICYVLNDLRRDVAIRFVEIGKIVNHYCLSFHEDQLQQSQDALKHELVKV